MAAVEFLCDLSQRGTPLPHCWEHTVGSCHAPLALRSDWQAHLRVCHDELGFRYVRFHGLLSDDVGTLVRTREGLLDSFLNADRIFDFLLSIGMTFRRAGFLPEALASGPTTVFKYRGNVTPPLRCGQWAAFIKRLVAHWVDRYGIREVADWFFEVWNEPNLRAFWTGTRKDYFELYRATAGAIKWWIRHSGDGPSTARTGWRVRRTTSGAAVDFVSTHHYPTDALYPADPLWNEADDTNAAGPQPTQHLASVGSGYQTPRAGRLYYG
jgi:xylan 1,4-beta-xylosidase